MKDLKKIVVPVDLTAGARVGLEFALALAADNGAELIVLHVAHPYQAWQVMDENGIGSGYVCRWEADRIVRETLLDLIRFIEPSLRKAPRVEKLRRSVALGDIVDKIVEVAAVEKTDLIVMSPRRRGTLSRLILGSVTDKVTRLAPCPVLSVCRETPRPRRGKDLPLTGAFLRESEA